MIEALASVRTDAESEPAGLPLSVAQGRSCSPRRRKPTRRPWGVRAAIALNLDPIESKRPQTCHSRVPKLAEPRFTPVPAVLPPNSTGSTLARRSSRRRAAADQTRPSALSGTARRPRRMRTHLGDTVRPSLGHRRRPIPQFVAFGWRQALRVHDTVGLDSDEAFIRCAPSALKPPWYWPWHGAPLPMLNRAQRLAACQPLRRGPKQPPPTLIA